MNKLLAFFFALGAFAGFGMAQKYSYQTQNTGKFGGPVGPVRTVVVSKANKIGYNVFGFACLLGCLCFASRIRGDDSRK